MASDGGKRLNDDGSDINNGSKKSKRNVDGAVSDGSDGSGVSGLSTTVGNHLVALQAKQEKERQRLLKNKLANKVKRKKAKSAAAAKKKAKETEQVLEEEEEEEEADDLLHHKETGESETTVEEVNDRENDTSIRGAICNLAETLNGVMRTVAVLSAERSQRRQEGAYSAPQTAAGELVAGAHPGFPAGLPPGELVSDNMRMKIWQDKYVDFRDLLDKDQPTYHLKVQDRPLPGEAASLDSFLRVEQNSKKELEHGEWVQAFKLFSACYLKRFEGTAVGVAEVLRVSQELIEYEMLINTMAKDNLDWGFYDKKFRKDREISKVSFAYMRYDLYARATSNSIKALDTQRSLGRNAMGSSLVGQPFRGQGVARSIFVPPPFCFKFHKEDQHCYVPGCTFRHTCFLCSAYHPAYRCPRRPGSSTQDRERDLDPRTWGQKYSRQDKRGRRPPYPYTGRPTGQAAERLPRKTGAGYRF